MRIIEPARDGDTASPGRATTLVVGGGRIGLALATELARDGRQVTFVGVDEVDERGDEDGVDERRNEDKVDERDDEVEVLDGRVSDGDSLRAVLEAVGDVAAVVAVGTDSEALLVAHLARMELDDVAIVAFVDDPWRLRAFDGIDVEPIETSVVLADAIRDRLRETALV